MSHLDKLIGPARDWYPSESEQRITTLVSALETAQPILTQLIEYAEDSEPGWKPEYIQKFRAALSAIEKALKS